MRLAALVVVVALQQGDTARRTPATVPTRAPASAPASAPAPVPAAAPGAVARAQARREANKAEHQYDDTFRRCSKRYFGAGFDWRWFKAQGLAESNLDPQATSRVGARGVMQLMPSSFGIIQSARPEFLSIDDPEWNIAAGIMHDRHLWRLWGPRVPRWRYRETLGYVRKIDANYERLRRTR